MIKKIIENKVKEVEINKEKIPLFGFKDKLTKSSRDFRKALSKDKLNLIAEFKRKSPSKNISEIQFDIERTLGIYNRHADAISILTDNKFFSGSLDEMKKASEIIGLPILRKDFIIDEYQIYESRLYNADAILLIASILSKDKLDSFIKLAGKYKMDCLVEIHTKEELEKVLDTKSKIIGINNRDLDTLKIDLNTTLAIADKIPSDMIIVSESGIQDRNYVQKISKKVNAILVGSLFMNSKDIDKEITSLIKWQR